MTTESRYVAKHSPDELETQRLEALEAQSDGVTRRHLQGLGLAEGWRCLEVGAGRGSVVRWLAEQVGPTGRVVAADMNPRFLWDLASDVIDVREHDVLAKDFEPHAFDLAHCRALLMHLPTPELALERMAAGVRPGGWLCIEEGDFFSFQAADPADPRSAVFDKAMEAIRTLSRRSGVMDPDFGRRARGLLESLGLEDVGSAGTLLASRGADPEARFWHLTFQIPGANATVPAGLLSQEEFDEAMALFEDPTFGFISPTMFAAWGRKPS